MALHRDLRRQRERSRGLLLAATRHALAELGDELVEAHRAEESALDAVAHYLPGALAAGLSVSDVAELTGLSRQKIYELRRRHTFAEDEASSRVLVQLAAGGPQPVDAITHALDDLSREQVEDALGDLRATNAVTTFSTEYETGTPEEWFALTAEGEARLGDLPVPDDRPKQSIVYARIHDDERSKLEAAAVAVFGTERFGFIPPGTVSGQEWTELAFPVAAENADAALALGRERLEELRRAAGISQRPAIITAISPGPLG
jgi:transcriptional regulator with XRE-family HTH domain